MNLKFVITLLIISSSLVIGQNTGKYFFKKNYVSEPIPAFNESKHLIPSPIFESNDDLLKMYWKCWEIAFKGLKQPPENSPLVSNWIDEAFSENIFQWDTIFMILFARYIHNIFPSIESLDNFYALQRESGFIGREFREHDGKTIHYNDGNLFHPLGWKNTINPPLFAWAELESFKLTGDLSRLEQVFPVLEKYAEWLNQNGDPKSLDWENNGRRSVNTAHKLFWNTPLGSGMDNTPRPADEGAGWVEMSSQMVLMYNNLAEISSELKYIDKATKFKKEAQSITHDINEWCWNERDGFYYDVLSDGTQFKKKTIGGFWPLVAEIASKEQAAKLVEHLKDEKEFWRVNVFPSLSADEEEYDSIGGYWLGGVWAPTNVMVIKGLEKYGFENFATEATEKYLNAMLKVFDKTNTVWENYSPEFYTPGEPSKPDFVGWTGCGPISLFIENILGIRIDGIRKTIFWKISENEKHGIKNLWLGENKIDLIFDQLEGKEKVKVKTEGFLTLIVHRGNYKKTYELPKGNHILNINDN